MVGDRVGEGGHRWSDVEVAGGGGDRRLSWNRR